MKKSDAKKILIYPFTDSCIPFLNALNLHKYNIILSSPRGWGYDDRMYFIDDHVFQVTTAFDSYCMECDEVWFVYSDIKIDDELIISKIRITEKHKKKARYFLPMTDKIKQVIRIENSPKVEVADGLGIIHTPIVLVVGLFQNSGGWESELSLLNGELYDNYNIIQIASKAAGEVLGMRRFPEFMTDSDYSDAEKIRLFNRYLESIEQLEKPDIFIIGVPDGVSAYSRDIPEGFGMLFTMITKAVPVDIVVLSVPYMKCNNTDIDTIRRNALNKFHLYVDYINISNKRILPYDSDSAHKLKYLTVDTQKVERIVKALGDNTIYHLECKPEQERLQRNIIRELLKFGEIQFI